MKTNPKNLQKQHGYKPYYILKKKNINNINIKGKPSFKKIHELSMSYEFKPDTNHNHSNNNYPKHNTLTKNK